MSLPDNYSPRDAVGIEGNSTDPYPDVPDNVLRFTSGSRFEGMFLYEDVGCQHHGPPMQAAPTIDIPLGQGILIDERTVLSFSSMPSSSPSASQSGEPHLMQPTYTEEQGVYAGHDLPVVSDFHQGFVGDGSEDHVYCSPPSFGGQWHIIPVDDALANGEQDAISCLEPSSAASHHPPLPEGSDMMEIMPTGHTTQSGGPRVFRCQHHARGGPCGLLIEGDIQDALEHFARVHVHRPRPIVTKPSSPANVWTCRWGGKCNISMLKENFRRHVTAHLVRWQCLNCPRTYSRDDSARRHARDCGGDGSIITVPRLNDRPHKRRKRTGGKGKGS